MDRLARIKELIKSIRADLQSLEEQLDRADTLKLVRKEKSYPVWRENDSWKENLKNDQA